MEGIELQWNVLQCVSRKVLKCVSRKVLPFPIQLYFVNWSGPPMAPVEVCVSRIVL
jgi:hypothetical protein